jgi:hypothetical protein
VATPRNSSYIWVTWITGLLSGDRHCLWSAWYRAHFKGYERRPTSFDLAAWTATHAEMVRARAEALRADGYQVYVEDQNKFTLRGRAATLGGVPDLVAVRETSSGGREALVVDCKSGRQRNSDFFQVLTYMLVLPLTHPALTGVGPSGVGPSGSAGPSGVAGSSGAGPAGQIVLSGELQYRDMSIAIPAVKLTDDLRRQIRTMIETIGGGEEPARVPSVSECRFCDLCAPDCPDRIDEEESGTGAGGAAGATAGAGRSPGGAEHGLF